MECIGPYTLGKTLGEGTTGKVKLGTHKITGATVAIKIIKKSQVTQTASTRRKIEREISVMKLFKHKNVLELFEVFQNSKYIFLVLEHIQGGELFDYVVKRGRLPDDEAFHFFKQIILGLEYCHTKLICHRDLKLENLLVDGDKNIKIADFGMANMMSETSLLETSCGSPHYASPEVAKGEKYHGTEADVWSVGVILFALVCGRLPFDDEDIGRLLYKVRQAQYQIPDFLDADLRDLISQMLQINTSKRITIKQIKAHKWWLRMEKKEIQPVGEESEKSPVEPQPNIDLENNEEEDIREVEGDVLASMAAMGWQDTEAVKSQITNTKENTIEKVLYKLLLKRRQETASVNIASNANNSSDNGNLAISLEPVSVLNPISDEINSPPSPSGQSSRRFSFSTSSLSPTPRRNSWFAKFMKWKNGSKPDSPNKNVATPSFGIHSNKTLNEIFSNLESVFGRLGIQFNYVSDIQMQATYYIDKKDAVEFDVYIEEVDNSPNTRFINFCKISGDTKVVFETIQQNLQL